MLRVAGGVAHPSVALVGVGMAGNDDDVEPGGGRSSAVGGFAAAASQRGNGRSSEALLGAVSVLGTARDQMVTGVMLASSSRGGVLR